MYFAEAVISQKNSTWRVIDVIKSSTDYLEEHKIENPRLNAEWLLCKILGESRINLYVRFDQPLTKKERGKYKEFIYRRVQREPLQYITEQSEFMSLSFRVNKNVLIPRPETEIMVEFIIKQYKGKKVRIFDIGGGSGAISVSLAHYLKDSKVLCADISEEALRIAEENAVKNSVNDRIDFKCIDIMTEDIKSCAGGLFDVVVSNPPYVSKEEWKKLAPEIVNHEPKNALVAEENGLAFYPAIVRQAKSILKKGGLIAVEVGYGQSDDVAQIFRSSGLKNLQILNDYNGIQRVVTGTY
ncbi:peptide chain release factor N(5)-glutamine methyltransferase [bacterium]|nr:peptide chain release factor N(5)-glutamine methyltransferase [bacterium]